MNVNNNLKQQCKENISMNSLSDQKRENLIIQILTVRLAFYLVIPNIFLVSAFVYGSVALVDEIGLGWFKFFITFFIISGILFFWIAIVWRITVESNGIRFRNFFAKTKIINFKEIEKASINFEEIEKIRKEKRSIIYNFSTITLYSKEEKKILAATLHYTECEKFTNLLEQESIKFE